MLHCSHSGRDSTARQHGQCHGHHTHARVCDEHDHAPLRARATARTWARPAISTARWRTDRPYYSAAAGCCQRARRPCHQTFGPRCCIDLVAARGRCRAQWRQREASSGRRHRYGMGRRSMGDRAARSRATVHGAPEGTVGGTAGGMATAISMLTASAWSHCHCHRHRHRTQPWRRRRRARWRGGQHDHHTHVCTEREHGHTTTHAWRRRCGHGPQRGRGHAPPLARPRRKGPPSISLRHALTGRAARRLQGAASVPVSLAARCFDRVASPWWQGEASMDRVRAIVRHGRAQAQAQAHRGTDETSAYFNE